MINDDFGDFEDLPQPPNQDAESAQLQQDLDAANLSLAALNAERDNLNVRVDELTKRFTAKQVALDESIEREQALLIHADLEKLSIKEERESTFKREQVLRLLLEDNRRKNSIALAVLTNANSGKDAAFVAENLESNRLRQNVQILSNQNEELKQERNDLED